MLSSRVVLGGNAQKAETDGGQNVRRAGEEAGQNAAEADDNSSSSSVDLDALEKLRKRSKNAADRSLECIDFVGNECLDAGSKDADGGGDGRSDIIDSSNSTVDGGLDLCNLCGSQAVDITANVNHSSIGSVRDVCGSRVENSDNRINVGPELKLKLYENITTDIALNRGNNVF